MLKHTLFPKPTCFIKVVSADAIAELKASVKSQVFSNVLAYFEILPLANQG